VIKIRVLLLCCVCWNLLFADDSREGFFASIAIGKHETEAKEKGNTLLTIKGTTTSIHAGYGLSNTVQLYFARETNWISPEYTSYTFSDNLDALGVVAFCGEYIYVKGAIGTSKTYPIAIPKDISTGKGYLLGFGYEFSNNIALEANLLELRWSEAIRDKNKIDISELEALNRSLRFLFRYSFY
jgi:hypothetical protein